MIRTSRQLKALVRNMSQNNSSKALIIIRNYVMERFLERLSLSPYRDNLIMKGGILVSAMVGPDNRSTLDIDATIKNLPLSVMSRRPLYFLLQQTSAFSAVDPHPAHPATPSTPSHTIHTLPHHPHPATPSTPSHTIHTLPHHPHPAAPSTPCHTLLLDAVRSPKGAPARSGGSCCLLCAKSALQGFGSYGTDKVTG